LLYVVGAKIADEMDSSDDEVFGLADSIFGRTKSSLRRPSLRRRSRIMRTGGIRTPSESVLWALTDAGTQVNTTN